MKKRFLGPIVVCFIVGMALGIAKLNNWIQGEVVNIVDQPAQTTTAESPPVVKAQIPKPKENSGEVIRRVRLAPERTFEISIFYQGGKEIARHKVSRDGMIYDQAGAVPNGKVKFINETDQTYGVEYYRSGLKDGPSRVHYKDGALKHEAKYQFGRLLTGREYFQDGTLKMEEDHTDARESRDGKEAGIGKVYSRDGRLKYEWYFVNSDPVAYRKSYDRNSRLTAELYYDQDGNLVQPKAEIITNNVPAGAN